MLRSNHDLNQTTTRGGPARLRPRSVRARPAPGRRVLAGDPPAYRAGRRRAGEWQHRAAVVRGERRMSEHLTLLFLTVCGAAAIVAWLVDLPNRTDLEAGTAAIVMGLGAGMLIGAWT